MIKVIDKFDIMRYLVKTIMAIIVITYITGYFFNVFGNKNKEEEIKNMAKQGANTLINKLSEQSFINCINATIPLISYEKDSANTRERVYENINRSGYKRVLNTEIRNA